MPVAPGNRLYTAFLVRLMYVFPAICPRKVEKTAYLKRKIGIWQFDTSTLFGDVSHTDNPYSINLCLPSYGFWRTHS